MIESEDTMRARFLMSPYNVREARRVKEFKRGMWAITLMTLASLALIGTIVYLR